MQQTLEEAVRKYADDKCQEREAPIIIALDCAVSGLYP